MPGIINKGSYQKCFAIKYFLLWRVSAITLLISMAYLITHTIKIIS
jgi:hypothetical protein